MYNGPKLCKEKAWGKKIKISKKNLGGVKVLTSEHMIYANMGVHIARAIIVGLL